MTNKQYETIIALLTDKLIDQNSTIEFQKLRLEILERKLKEAEKHIEKE